MFPFPSIGTGIFSPRSHKLIRLIRHGCTNRPFFHIAVLEFGKDPHAEVIEQLGTYDPLPNMFNEKLIAINFKRFEHWLLQGVFLTPPVQELLGLSGYFPVHPDTIEKAWNNRKKIMAKLEELRTEVANLQQQAEEPKTSVEQPSATDSFTASSDSATAPSDSPIASSGDSGKPPEN